jgi:hypothetical protein
MFRELLAYPQEAVHKRHLVYWVRVQLAAQGAANWQHSRSIPNAAIFGGLAVSMLASGTKVCGFEPGRSRRIFQGEKILSKRSFGGEVKLSYPCRRFAACKRTLHWRRIRLYRQNYRSFLAHSPPLSLLEVCYVVVGVGTPGSASGNFQRLASTISLHGCGTSGSTSFRGPMEEEEEEVPVVQRLVRMSK